MKRVMVIEDELSIAKLLEHTLKQAGYDIMMIHNGIDAVEMALSEKPDLLLLDIMLPGMDGLDVCRVLRQEKFRTPIVMLTAKGEEFDKVLGLELGADDYLTKPFSPRELLARVKAAIRRSEFHEMPAVGRQGYQRKQKEEYKLCLGELVIYPDQFAVELRGAALELTPKEFELLLYLARHEGRVLNREQLLDAVWNYEYTGDSRIVDVHISHLRDKIEKDTKKPGYIKTVRGFGYKLENPV